MGMYIFGNSKCLINAKQRQNSPNSELWPKVITYLKNNDFLNNELNLQCNLHKNVTKVKEAKDFDDVPEGGCK